ncbi:MAG: nuclear transport factor 2 family protein [Granulosicoccus sp.]
MSRLFKTPDAAETAFYDAIERGDMAALDEVWSRDESIVCIHPGSLRIEGRFDVLQSFQEMFSDSPTLSFSIVDALHTGNENLAVHLVREEISLENEVVSVMLSTNIFHLEDGGWRMLLHHASHEPDLDFDMAMAEFDDADDFDDDEYSPPEPPPVLH